MVCKTSLRSAWQLRLGIRELRVCSREKPSALLHLKISQHAQYIHVHDRAQITVITCKSIYRRTGAPPSNAAVQPAMRHAGINTPAAWRFPDPKTNKTMSSSQRPVPVSDLVGIFMYLERFQGNACCASKLSVAVF